jgi:uncharacterized protein YlzI (FlbEa/FlbD family)
MDFTNGQKVYGEIVQKAWEDDQFKSNLMTNPIETIEKFTGNKINLPEGKTLVVKDQTDEAMVYLNIPRKVNFDNLELTDEQLEAVAGGEIVVGMGIGLAIVGLVAAGYAYAKS